MAGDSGAAELAAPSSSSTPVSIVDGRAYVWSASDVLQLRRQHRIIGLLSGSLPLLPQQNAYLGLPLQLMPEEVTLLLQRNAIVLVNDSATLEAPTRQQWEQLQRQKEQDVHAQKVAAWRAAEEHKRIFEEKLVMAKHAKKEMGNKGEAEAKERRGSHRNDDEQHARQIIEKRKARWEEKHRQALDDDDVVVQIPKGDGGGAGSQGTTSTTTSPATTTTSANQPPPPAPPPAALSNFSHAHVTHDRTCTLLPWHAPASSSPAHLIRQFQPQAQSVHSTRALIFSQLNNDGFYLGCGLRFGGDFVVYPGDPFRYHSHFTLTVPQSSEAPFSAGKLIADGRLGTAVKKAHLIGTLKEGKQDEPIAGEEEMVVARQSAKEKESSLYSITWAGFGT